MHFEGFCFPNFFEERPRSNLVIFALRKGLEMAFVSADKSRRLRRDVMMPGMSGYKVAEHLRSKYPTRALPIIMVSAKSAAESIATGLNHGANDYVSKPFKKVELLARVRTQIQLKQVWQKEMREAEELRLLHKILPYSVTTRLLHDVNVLFAIFRIFATSCGCLCETGEHLIADSFDSVTILFADIEDFSSLAAHLSTPNLLLLVNEIFATFDKLAEKCGVQAVTSFAGKTTFPSPFKLASANSSSPEWWLGVGGAFGSSPYKSLLLDLNLKTQKLSGKEHTEGAAFVAVVSCIQKDHAVRMMRFAEAMLKASQKLTHSNGKHIKVRVGVHTGRAYAGVVGINAPRYCYFGDTVSFADVLRQTGVPSCVQLSGSTYNKCRESKNSAAWNFISRTIELEGAKNAKGAVGVKAKLTLTAHGGLKRQLSPERDEYMKLKRQYEAAMEENRKLNEIRERNKDLLKIQKKNDELTRLPADCSKGGSRAQAKSYLCSLLSSDFLAHVEVDSKNALVQRLKQELQDARVWLFGHHAPLLALVTAHASHGFGCFRTLAKMKKMLSSRTTTSPAMLQQRQVELNLAVYGVVSCCEQTIFHHTTSLRKCGVLISSIFLDIGFEGDEEFQAMLATEQSLLMKEASLAAVRLTRQAMARLDFRVPQNGSVARCTE
eukprot:jgi/Bigna1/82038/fgenesh1_pg.87_\